MTHPEAGRLSPEDRVLLGRPDVLFIAVGGGAKAYSGPEAAEVVRELQPRRVIPVQYQSGKPATTTYGYNTARTDGYFRIDARIDKRAVWNKWLFDFYVDLTNVSLFPEEIVPGATIRYVLPTVGIRGRL